MAVFLINICKFNGCGITFPSLGDLIQHIEDTHIDYDPKVVEQKEQAQPACLPLSYVLRFISEDARKGAFLSTNSAGVELKRKLAIKHHSYSMSSSNRSNTPTGSEMDEDEMVVSESEDSNDSWTTEEFSSEFIMRYGSRHSGSGGNGAPGNEKPFACPVPGCKKRYKNVNGIKYHSKNGHKKDGKVRKGYKCHCGKSYKTAQGLKSHALAAHNSTADNALSTPHAPATGHNTNNNNNNSGNNNNNCNSTAGNNMMMQRSTSPSQSLGSLSPSSISNMSSSTSSCHGGSGGNGQNLGAASMLQHLTNGIVSGVTAGSCGTAGACLPAATNGGSIGHQLHYTAASNGSQNNSGSQSSSSIVAPSAAAVAAVTTEIGPFPLYCGHAISTPTSTATAPATPITPPAAKATVNCRAQPKLQQQSHHPRTTNTGTYYGQHANISPTFIEHKYSAHPFKEKFLANLRHNHGSRCIKSNRSNHSRHSLPGHCATTTAATSDIHSAHMIATAVMDSCGDPAAGIVDGVAAEMCSIQQQVNEDFKMLICNKKTIN